MQHCRTTGVVVNECIGLSVAIVQEITDILKHDTLFAIAYVCFRLRTAPFVQKKLGFDKG